MQKEVLDIIFNITGILGAALILIAYFMLQLGKIKADELKCPILNLIGALMLLISLFRFWNLPSVIIQVFWILISIYGIIKIRFKKTISD